MAVDTQGLSNRYLAKVLADGSRPFRYRSRLRVLLGLPADEGVKVSLPRPLPGAGFVYRQPRWVGAYNTPNDWSGSAPDQLIERVDEVVDLSAIASKLNAEIGESRQAAAFMEPEQLAERNPSRASSPRLNSGDWTEAGSGAAAMATGRAEEADRSPAKRQEATIVKTAQSGETLRPVEAADAAMTDVRPAELSIMIPGVTERMTAPPMVAQAALPLVAADSYAEEGSTQSAAGEQTPHAKEHEPQPTAPKLPTASPSVYVDALAVATQQRGADGGGEKEESAQRAVGEQMPSAEEQKAQPATPKRPAVSPVADAYGWPAASPSGNAGVAGSVVPPQLPGRHAAQAAGNLTEADAGDAITGETTTVARRLPPVAPLRAVAQTQIRLSPPASGPSPIVAEPLALDSPTADASHQTAPAPTIVVSRPANAADHRTAATVATVAQEPARVALNLPLQTPALMTQQVPARLLRKTAVASSGAGESVGAVMRATAVVGQHELRQLEAERDLREREAVEAPARRQPHPPAKQSSVMHSAARPSESSTPSNVERTQPGFTAEADQPSAALPASPVIVRQAVRKHTPPPAFWERRYLSRLRTRILR